MRALKASSNTDCDMSLGGGGVALVAHAPTVVQSTNAYAAAVPPPVVGKTPTLTTAAATVVNQPRVKASPVRKVIAKRKAKALEKALAASDRRFLKRDSNVLKRASRTTAKDVY